MVRRRRSTGSVKRQAVQRRILCALQALLKDVPRMATPPDGITFPVGNTSATNASTTTTEATRMDTTSTLHGRECGPAMARRSQAPRHSWQTSSCPTGFSAQNPSVESGGSLPRRSSLLHTWQGRTAAA